MSETTYRAGIIGLGMIGGADQVSGDVLGQRVKDLDGTHSSALYNHPQVELVAGSSRDIGRRARFEARTGAKVYSDWKQMLDQETFDIVSIATYAPIHAEITIGCAEHGVRAIYCEKPIATNLFDAECMVQACKKTGALLVINHQRRFNLNFRQLRDLIASGELGELTSISLQWGSGRLGNVGTHMIDAALMLSGQNAQAVSGTLDLAEKPDCRGPEFRDPGGWGIIRLKDDVMVTVDAGDYSNVPGEFTINGTRGRAIIGDEVHLQYWEGHEENWKKKASNISSMDRAVSEIVACLDKKILFSYPVEDAFHTLEIILAFHISNFRKASWTNLPLTGKDRNQEVLSG